MPIALEDHQDLVGAGYELPEWRSVLRRLLIVGAP